jgi:Right handed beta helix region
VKRVGHALVVVAAALGGVLALAGVDAAESQPERPVFVVAPDGDDSGAGSLESPWRTISRAARSVPPGALVDIRGGVYRERVVVQVSGAPGSPTTFAAHTGERVTISGHGLRRLPDNPGLIQVSGRSNLEFQGLELRDLVVRRKRFTPAGVWITGAASNITLRGLDIHDIRTRARRDGNAHGIAVYGGSGSSAITGVTIAGNTVHDLRLGESEAIAINGNVDGWQVVGNTVDDVNNIGIDAIGFEGTAPRNDRARNGLIADNAVSDVETLGNPAYGRKAVNCRCAGGIYVDGGDDIVIERNRVTRSNLGIELASEVPGGKASDVVLRNNLVTLSDRAGLTMGGFEPGKGKTVRARVVNNTFLDNDQLRDGVGEVVLNWGVLDSSVLNNVFRARARGVLVTNGYHLDGGNVFDGNVWFSAGRDADSATWEWRDKRVTGFGAWQSVTGGDVQGRYADPLLDGEGRPLAGSPVIDAGVATLLAGDTDLDGAPRLRGAALDAGSFETTP